MFLDDPSQCAHSFEVIALALEDGCLEVRCEDAVKLGEEVENALVSLAAMRVLR